MANNTNLCTFTGTITRDPETRATATGKSITKFSIAINKGRKGNETTVFLNIDAWEKLGGIVGQYAKKGDKILVTGELTHRKYTNNNGEEKDAWGLTASQVELLGGPRKGGNGGPYESTGGYAKPEDKDESIPF
jgi:single-strand DNA-binding protein